jgi:hypothetical protein
VLVNPSNPNAESLTKDAQAAGSAIGRQIEILAVSTARDIDAVFASVAQKHADADPLLDNRRLAQPCRYLTQPRQSSLRPA